MSGDDPTLRAERGITASGVPRISGAPLTPTELKSARHALGLSAEGFARVVRVQSGRTVRRWEAGDRDIPGPVIVIVELLQRSAEARRLLHIGQSA